MNIKSLKGKPVIGFISELNKQILKMKGLTH